MLPLFNPNYRGLAPSCMRRAHGDASSAKGGSSHKHTHILTYFAS